MEVREIHQIYNSIYIDTNIGLIYFRLELKTQSAKIIKTPPKNQCFLETQLLNVIFLS